MIENTAKTQPKSYQTQFEVQKKRARSFSQSTAKERIEYLKNLKREIETRRPEIIQAVYQDFKRNPLETELAETWLVLKEINFAIKKIKSWMRPKKVPTPLVFLGTRSSIQYEAKGTVLILSPWNFPFNLSLAPLVSAIAAGNTVILRPSEYTPHSSALIKAIVNAVFPDDLVHVAGGGVEVAKELTSLPFDHIFFTGSPKVGSLVMASAAKNLTSVTLELGGKSPVIVEESADLVQAARKAVFAKYLNNGQVCLATDYVLVQESIAEAFKRIVLQELERMYPNESVKQNPDYSRIVNQRQFAIMQALLHDAQQKGAKLETVEMTDEDDLYLSPTVISNVDNAMRIAHEEIFGPILPVKTFTQIEEAIDVVNAGTKPLVMYIFTRSKKVARVILANTSSGAALVNDVYIHHFNSNLPFGGVNQSGIGKSHGYFGFLEFSNQKAVLEQWLPFSTSSLLQPPYSAVKKKLVNLIVKFFS